MYFATKYLRPYPQNHPKTHRDLSMQSHGAEVNFSVRRTVAELRGVKVAQFSDFGLFSPYKTPKKYLPVTSLQPRGYIAK